MDGAGTIFSSSVAAGNFDGIPGDEFAVVYRDNNPANADGIYKNQYRTHHFHGGMTSCKFEGLTGGVNIVTYKWDGSTFQSAPERKTYDYFNIDNGWTQSQITTTWIDKVQYDLPVAVKAIAADVNGNGRDEVVVLRMSLQFEDYDSFTAYSSSKYGDDYTRQYFSYFRIKPCIDVWNFYGESIQPYATSTYDGLSVEYKGGTDQKVYADKKNLTLPRPMFIKMLSRTDTPYPFFEREFDIVKGEFTGRVGEVTTADDLVIKCPSITADNSIKEDGDNHVNSVLILLKGYDGNNFNDVRIQENITHDYAVGLMTANFLGEGAKLGEPTKITINKDDDYSAILQAVPYHVDNLTEDGTALAAQPRNFTLRKDTAVTYKNSSTKEDEKNLSYSMTKKAETIFALDSSLTRGTSLAFQGVRGITSAFFGATDFGKAVSSVGQIWDKLKDTVETTTSTSNQSAEEFAVTIMQQSNYQDSLYYSQSSKYLWRYPVLTYPAPSWLIGQVKDTLGSFDKSQVKDQQMYITFAMSEPSTPTTGIGINDTNYQPYHELGNLFSYPADLSQIKGYEGHTYMANNTYNENNPIEWRGSNFNQTITFTKSEMNQEETKTVNKRGAITKFLSMIDNIFGTSLAHIPADSDS